jgi:hypothetical protein
MNSQIQCNLDSVFPVHLTDITEAGTLNIMDHVRVLSALGYCYLNCRGIVNL